MQAALVALPAPRPRPAWIERLASPWWALIPALSIVVVVAVLELSASSATALTYLALVAVPPLAAYALAELVRVRLSPPYTWFETDSRYADPGWLVPASIAAVLFTLAWVSARSLLGDAAATALSALACVSLGWLLVCVVSATWLRCAIYAMATIDAVYVAADLLQSPNAVLNAATPTAGLPQLQSVHFGSALMGFGDLFVAALVGCLLAAEGTAPESDRHRGASRQSIAAVLVAVLALTFDLLFFFVDVLPATVPVAVALALVSRRRIAQL